MSILGVAWDMVRLLAALAMLAEADNNSQRLARCRARSAKGGPVGPIAQGLAVLFNLEDLLWRRILGWEPNVPMGPARPCSPCGHEEVD